MDETVSGTLTPAPARWLTLFLSVLVAVAFVVTAMLFAVLLRPLAGDKPVLELTQITANEIIVSRALPEVGLDPPPAIQSGPVAPSTPAAPAGPRIAIVLTGLGADRAQAGAAIANLPPEVGLAFSPYPDATRSLATTARVAGHEIWAGIPMQPKSWPRVSPGANTLIVGAPDAENRRRLVWALARIGPVTGVTSIMGSAFTESARSLDPMLVELRARNVAFLDSRVSATSIGFSRARAQGVPTLLNDGFLDESGDIADRLVGLERLARANGSAVGFASPRPSSVAAIAAWAATLEAKGLTLVAPGTLAK